MAGPATKQGHYNSQRHNRQIARVSQSNNNPDSIYGPSSTALLVRKLNWPRIGRRMRGEILTRIFESLSMNPKVLSWANACCVPVRQNPYAFPLNKRQPCWELLTRETLKSHPSSLKPHYVPSQSRRSLRRADREERPVP